LDLFDTVDLDQKNKVVASTFGVKSVDNMFVVRRRYVKNRSEPSQRRCEEKCVCPTSRTAL
jgi:hypothetical protein